MKEKLFGFDQRKTTVRTEIMAGLTTFLTMAYILAVNPDILSNTGMDKGALFTTTVLMAALPTIFMAIYAKQPLALAPGMGLNAFFAYTICEIMGYSWQFALTAVFFEGLVFMLLTVTNLREKIVDVIPASLKNAISAGIGLYIAFIGLKNGGVIVIVAIVLVVVAGGVVGFLLWKKNGKKAVAEVSAESTETVETENTEATEETVASENDGNSEENHE